jgi:type VI secretion system secreted protein VgrG
MVLGEEKITVTSDKTPITLTDGQGTIEINGSGELTITGKKVTIEATTGDVIVKGTNVNLTGNGDVSIAANANFEAKGAMAKVEGSGMTTIKGGMVAIN